MTDLEPGVYDLEGGTWGGYMHLKAVARVRRMLTDPYILMPNSGHWGLSRWHTNILPGFPKLPYLSLTREVPFGWKLIKDENRGIAQIMPWWLAAFVIAWRNWPRWVFEPLIAMGLWYVSPGDYFVNGRLTAPKWLRAFVWCFLNDRDHVNPFHGIKVRRVQGELWVDGRAYRSLYQEMMLDIIRGAR